MTDINAAVGAQGNHGPQVSNGFNQSVQSAATAAAGIGKVALNRLMHPDAGVIGAAFQHKGAKILIAALPSVGALKSGNLENILQNSTYFLSIVDQSGTPHVFTGNPSSGIVEVGKPNFASKAFSAAGMNGVVFSNSRVGGNMSTGEEIVGSVNSGLLISDIAPQTKARAKKGLSKAIGKMIETLTKKMLNKVRNDDFEPQRGKNIKGTVIKNALELTLKKPVNDLLINQVAKASGRAFANSLNNSANFMVGVAYRDDVRINPVNSTVSFHGAVNTTEDFGTLKKALDEILP